MGSTVCNHTGVCLRTEDAPVAAVEKLGKCAKMQVMGRNEIPLFDRTLRKIPAIWPWLVASAIDGTGTTWSSIWGILMMAKWWTLWIYGGPSQNVGKSTEVHPSILYPCVMRWFPPKMWNWDLTIKYVVSPFFLKWHRHPQKLGARTHPTHPLVNYHVPPSNEFEANANARELLVLQIYVYTYIYITMKHKRFQFDISRTISFTDLKNSKLYPHVGNITPC